VSGWSYDNAGNLTDDGTATYVYDALGRMTGQGSTTYAYNGDGVLVYDGTTRYTQDLAAPLSQILQTTQGSATTDYLYGLDRLAAVAGSTRTWYGADALGSVRQTISDSGISLGVVSYDPWGTPESGNVPMFGFTGELQDSATGLVNLRARWYSTGKGAFTAHRWRATESDDALPYTHHPYAYGLSNPILYTDPTGKYYTTGNEDPSGCPEGYTWVASFQRAYNSDGCVPNNANMDLPATPMGRLLNEPLDIGFVVGVSGSMGYGSGGVAGAEAVFDLYDFEADTFVYGGFGGLVIGASANFYTGAIMGWAGYNNEYGIGNYKGPFASGAVSGGPVSVQGVLGAPDPTTGARLYGVMLGMGISTGALNVKGVKVPIEYPKNLPEPLKMLCGSSWTGTWYWSLDSQDGDFKLLPTRQEFHRDGFRKQTSRDAREFIEFIRRYVGYNGLADAMVTIVRHNGRAWEKKNLAQR